MRERNPQIVSKGVWKYDDLIEKPVVVVRLNYDPGYESLAWEYILEDGDKPQLNCNGECFSLARPLGGDEYDLLGQAKLTINELKKYAEVFFASGVTWE